MPTLLENQQVDYLGEEVDVQLTAEEEAFETQRYRSTGVAPDLGDGGVVNGVRVRPNRDKTVTKGRAVARKAWMWNGTESLLPLAWDPEGKIHDGARRYLLKRHCLCCGVSGFRARQCPSCVKNDCNLCGGRPDPKTVIPCFYLRQSQVPFPSTVYGFIDCFLPSCIRTGARGFLTQLGMRMHARNRHKMEYQAHLETLAESRVDELQTLRDQVAELMQREVRRMDFSVPPVIHQGIVASPTLPQPQKERTEAEKELAKQRMAKARAAKRTFNK